MALKEPESAEEVFYFTNRDLENDGHAMAWVYRPDCPECGKGKMGKPVNPKTGRPIKKSEIYVCPECGHEENCEEYDETLFVEIKYKCPHCQKEGETTTEYKRKTYKGVPSYVFTCVDCGEKIGLTKKMKKPKKKK